MLSSLTTVLTDTTGAESGSNLVVNGSGGLIGYLIGAFAIWGMLGKAGLPKWGAFVPFYNAYLLVKMAGYNGWLFLVFVIPLVNIVWSIVVALRLATAFGKSGAFGFFLLWLLSLIGFLVCSYGSATYRHPVTGAATA